MAQSIRAIASVALQRILAYLSRSARARPASHPAAALYAHFGHAFEASEMANVPALLINRDETPRAQRFHRHHRKKQNVSVA